MATLEVKGLAEIDANLKRLGEVAGAKIMRGSLYAASRPILQQAKANVAGWPQGSGALHESLSRRYGVTNKGSRFAVSIGPKVKARTSLSLHNLHYRRRIRGIFYGHLLEFGHKDRAGGAVVAKPFLLPALRSKYDEAVRLLADTLRRRIERALKK